MSSPSFFRVEWISLVYLGFFVLAVLSPSIVTNDFFGISQHRIEEALIFSFGLLGLATFSITQRLMERKEREHEDARNEYERAKRELLESYRYIGSINRQIEVLKRVANQTSQQIIESNKLSKDLLVSLIGHAASSVGAKRAAIRYVELEKMRTQHEILHALEDKTSFRVPNRELKRLHDDDISHATLTTEDGQEILVIPSDHRGKAIKAYLLIVPDPNQEVADLSLLKVFANQAELLHYTLEEQPKLPATPLAMVEAAQKKVSGEVR